MKGRVLMNLRQLEYFAALVQTQHMTQAAKKMSTSQPNISHAISSLEQELGVPLIEKKGRNIVLTRYGLTFYEYVSDSLQRIYEGQETLTSMINPNSGKLEVGFIFTLGSSIVPQLIRNFHEIPENSGIRFTFHQRNSHKITEMVLNNQLDLGFCSKVTDDPELEYAVFAKEELVVVVPEGHELAQRESLTIEETANYGHVYYSEKSGLRPYLDQVMKDLNLHLQIDWELEEDHSVLGFVSHGFGIAIMPDISSISSYPVKKIRIENDLPDRNIYLVIKKNHKKPVILQKFYDFCLAESANKH